MPRGRIVEIYGPESSGKTTLTLQVIAEAQKIGGTCAFIDAEHALDPIYAQDLGVDIENLLVSQPDTGEQASNTAVDMSSWAVSACYPRRTFYPLSDGPSTQNHRITMTDFRLCSTCQSHSQAGLCHCTLRTISDRSEPTFARLRYYLGGDRPSQTTHHTMS